MFNIILSMPKLFLLTLLSFLILFTIRQLFIKQKKFVFLYHFCLFFILFALSIGGGGVQNAGYYNLEKFILLEKNNQLEEAKKNPQNYDSMLQSDLQEFKNSDEFRKYLKKHDVGVDRTESVFVGWIIAFTAEISMILAQLSGYIINKIRNVIAMRLTF